MEALVLSGGGAKGAFQVGALKRIVEKEPDFDPDVLTGTSVGALNAAFLSMYPRGQFAQGVADLVTLWGRVDHGVVWKKWYWGLLGKFPVLLPKWLGGQQSVYSTAPLRKLVDEVLDVDRVASSGRLLRVGAVSLSTGNRRIWTEQDKGYLARAVLASSSFPMFFEPVHIDGQVYTDDGVRETTPIEDAIKLGVDYLTVIHTGPPVMTGHFARDANGLELGQRILDSMSLEIEKNDVRVVDLYNALILVGEWLPEGHEFHRLIKDKRLIDMRRIYPKTSILDNALDFGQDKVQVNIDRGYYTAAETVG